MGRGFLLAAGPKHSLSASAVDNAAASSPQDTVLVDWVDPCIPTASANGTPECSVRKLPTHLRSLEATFTLLCQLYALLK